MALTTGIPNSTTVKLYTGGTPTAIARCTDLSLTINDQLRDITTKDSSGWEEKAEGLRSWSASASGLWEFAAATGANIKAMFDKMVTDRTAIEVEIGNGVAGNPKISGNMFVTSVELGSPSFEDNVTYSVEFTGTGAPTWGTYS